MIEVLAVDTTTLGDRSYLAHDGDVALVVDPQRDMDRLTGLAAERGLRITHVAETHMHNDYVTGGLALSRAAGASYLVNAADPVGFDRTAVRDGDSLAVGATMQFNPALTAGERVYIETLLAGLDAWPAYYAHMGPANIAGPGGPDLSPPRRADAAEVGRRIEAGEWVVDLRDRVAFASGFVPGSFSFPLDGSFATYLGWAIPWGTPVTLLGETPAQVGQAQRELVRIGIDRPAAAATGQPQDWGGGRPLASMRLAKFGDLAAAITASRRGGGDLVVLDVRRRLEWEESHIAGAAHIPFNELPGRLDEIPPGQVWVHCHSGYRSMVAASMLAARGRSVTSIDDEFDNAGTAGVRLTRR